jgi:hypothetical protein
LQRRHASTETAKRALKRLSEVNADCRPTDDNSTAFIGLAHGHGAQSAGESALHAVIEQVQSLDVRDIKHVTRQIAVLRSGSFGANDHLRHGSMVASFARRAADELAAQAKGRTVPAEACTESLQALAHLAELLHVPTGTTLPGTATPPSDTGQYGAVGANTAMLSAVAAFRNSLDAHITAEPATATSAALLASLKALLVALQQVVAVPGTQQRAAMRSITAGERRARHHRNALCAVIEPAAQRPSIAAGVMSVVGYLQRASSSEQAREFTGEGAEPALGGSAEATAEHLRSRSRRWSS